MEALFDASTEAVIGKELDPVGAYNCQVDNTDNNFTPVDEQTLAGADFDNAIPLNELLLVGDGTCTSDGNTMAVIMSNSHSKLDCLNVAVGLGDGVMLGFSVPVVDDPDLGCIIYVTEDPNLDGFAFRAGTSIGTVNGSSGDAARKCYRPSGRATCPGNLDCGNEITDYLKLCQGATCTEADRATCCTAPSDCDEALVGCPATHTFNAAGQCVGLTCTASDADRANCCLARAACDGNYNCEAQGMNARFNAYCAADVCNAETDKDACCFEPEQAACPEESDINQAFIPSIAVAQSGFNIIDGRFILSIEMGKLVNYERCYLEDADNNDNRWQLSDTLTSRNNCNDLYINDYSWPDMRDVLNLLDVSADFAPQKYRYEGIVVCTYSETVTHKDLEKDFPRETTHEMDFFINIPHEVSTSVEMTNRLSRPEEDKDVTGLRWTLDAGNYDTQVETIRTIVDGLATVSSADGANFVIEVTPLAKAEFGTVEPRGQCTEMEISDEKKTQINNVLAGVQPDTFEATATCVYFTPEAIVVSVDTEANRDELTVKITLKTVVETPWYFKDAEISVETDRTVSAEIDPAGGCQPNEDQCEQTWDIEVVADDLCGNTDVDVPVTIRFQPEAQDNVQGQNWNNPLGKLAVTLTMEQETFICSVELAEGEITASADMKIYADGTYTDDSKNGWRTSETPFFRVGVTSSQELLISGTELVTLTLVQNVDTDDERQTEIVSNKAAVAPLNTEGRRDMNTSPYTT